MRDRHYTIWINRYFRQHNVRPRVLMESNSLSTVIEIVQRTNLVTLLPTKIAGDRDALVSIELEPSRLRRTAVLLQRKGAYRTAAALAFVKLALAYGAAH
ncbi:DNA-binding transcriptional LysR family regulator [Burkholderia sp. 572]